MERLSLTTFATRVLNIAVMLNELAAPFGLEDGIRERHTTSTDYYQGVGVRLSTENFSSLCDAS